MAELPELKKTFVIFLTDTDPDTELVSQMIPIVHTETEGMAKVLTDFLNKDDTTNPNRDYSFKKL
jgi:hypothetical protein